MLSVIQDTPAQPCPAPFNLTQYVLAAGAANKDALVVMGRDSAQRWTYDALRRAVFGVARGLQGLGLPDGAPILMRLGNTVDFPITFLGAIAAGYLPVPTSAQLSPAEVSYLNSDIDPKLIIAGEGVALPEKLSCPVLNTDTLKDMFSLDPLTPALDDPNRPAYLIYTSGTSGRPRGVLHAHRAVWARRMMWAGWYDLHQTDRLMHAGAFNWTYTLGTGLMDPWAIGATALIPEPGTAAPDLAALIHQHKATLFAAAPGVYRQILKHCDTLHLPTLRHGLSAGEKLPDATSKAWQQATGTDIYEALGMSECSTFISGNPGHRPAASHTGYAQPGRAVAVMSETLAPVPRGQAGQLAIAATDPGLMLKYWNAEEETKQRFADGWFLTGDTVSMAEDGSIAYLGRDDDMMNAGGFRVSPIEVERTLEKCDGITEVAAVELQVKADVTVIATFFTGDPDAPLAEHATKHLARYKQPRLFIHRETLPKGGNGKLNRREIRRHYEAENGQA